ncbi:uncharacterized protein LOC108675752, partial [Hyalella azteca]|uniref:Uncharacterized protein LOC108675752 n=1 Tax=Hyalella azteca TaxID=294128 RepID=A0A8B7P2K7_HYAAZ
MLRDGGFIATQDPQQTTDDDDLFWSMVWEHQVSIIVRLSADDRNLGNNQMGCVPYLPLDRRWVFNNGIEASVKEKRQEEATHTTTTVVLVKTEGDLTLKKFKMSSDAGSQCEIPLLTLPIYDGYPDVMSPGVSKE